MSPTMKRWAVRIGQAVLAVFILVGIGSALKSCAGDVSFDGVRWHYFFAGFLVCMFYRIANAHGWWFVLRSLRVDLSIHDTVRIWLTSEACRWLPGSVWSYGSRAIQANRRGINASTAGASIVLELILTIGACAVTAFSCLVRYRSAFASLKERFPAEFVAVVLLCGAVIAMVVLACWKILKPRLEKKIRSFADKLRFLKTLRPDRRYVAMALLFFVAMTFVNGLAGYLLFYAVIPDCQVPLLAVVGASAAAWIVGFFAVIAPGGLVVREGAMAALLCTWVPLELAISAAVMWRAVQIVVELTCMGMLYVWPTGWCQSLVGQTRYIARSAR